MKEAKKINVTEDLKIYNMSKPRVCAAHSVLVVYRNVSRKFIGGFHCHAIKIKNGNLLIPKV